MPSCGKLDDSRGAYAIAHGFPIDFECMLLIINCLFVVGFPFSTWFFWAMGRGYYGLWAKCNAGRTYYKLGLGVRFFDWAFHIFRVPIEIGIVPRSDCVFLIFLIGFLELGFRVVVQR
jgi:hypothetical protein